MEVGEGVFYFLWKGWLGKLKKNSFTDCNERERLWKRVHSVSYTDKPHLHIYRRTFSLFRDVEMGTTLCCDRRTTTCTSLGRQYLFLQYHIVRLVLSAPPTSTTAVPSGNIIGVDERGCYFCAIFCAIFCYSGHLDFFGAAEGRCYLCATFCYFGVVGHTNNRNNMKAS